MISTTRADLDRENQSTYEIIVKAKDAPGSSGDSSTATVIITLTDINDNFPVFKHRKYNASTVSFGNRGYSEFMSEFITIQLFLKVDKRILHIQKVVCISALAIFPG